MTDIVERLREAGADYTVAWGSGDLYDEAADEIERLRAQLDAAVQVEREKCTELFRALERSDQSVAEHIAAAVAVERERCARIAESVYWQCLTGKDVADRIRAARPAGEDAK